MNLDTGIDFSKSSPLVISLSFALLLLSLSLLFELLSIIILRLFWRASAFGGADGRYWYLHARSRDYVRSLSKEYGWGDHYRLALWLQHSKMVNRLQPSLDCLCFSRALAPATTYAYCWRTKDEITIVWRFCCSIVWWRTFRSRLLNAFAVARQLLPRLRTPSVERIGMRPSLSFHVIVAA